MSVRLVEGRRIGLGLPLDQSTLRQAHFEDLRDAGFDLLVEAGNATELATVNNQHLIAWSGNGVVSPFELLLGFFPNPEAKPYTTLDDFSDGSLWGLHTAMVSFMCAAGEVEKGRTGKLTPSDVVFTQHIGGEESDAFQSFGQFHLHMFTDSTVGKTLSSYSKALRNGLHEPFTQVMSDIFNQSKLRAYGHFDSQQGAFVIADHVPHFGVHHLEILGECMTVWRQTWDEVARCFTGFKTDELNRFSVELNEDAWNSLLQTYYLSPQSMRLLSFLRQNLKPAAEQASPLSWLSKGVYGSLCIQHHADEDTWSIKIFPRTRITDFRTLTMNNEDITVFNKDRTLGYPAGVEAAYIQNQKETLQRMKQIFDNVVPFVIWEGITQGSWITRKKYPGRD